MVRRRFWIGKRRNPALGGCDQSQDLRGRTAGRAALVMRQTTRVLLASEVSDCHAVVTEFMFLPQAITQILFPHIQPLRITPVGVEATWTFHYSRLQDHDA
jgi:hypothetical protein